MTLDVQLTCKMVQSRVMRDGGTAQPDRCIDAL
jgi:hypothetical protein